MKYRVIAMSLFICSNAALAQDAKEAPNADAAPTTQSPNGPASATTLSGFADLSFKDNYVTPRGLVITNRGQAIQFVNGLNLQLANGSQTA